MGDEVVGEDRQRVDVVELGHAAERDVDNALWYRGQRPEYKARLRHRCRTVYY